jgi:hypothetical protein
MRIQVRDNDNFASFQNDGGLKKGIWSMFADDLSLQFFGTLEKQGIKIELVFLKSP